jgi:hypothetical protein
MLSLATLWEILLKLNLYKMLNMMTIGEMLVNTREQYFNRNMERPPKKTAQPWGQWALALAN